MVDPRESVKRLIDMATKKTRAAGRKQTRKKKKKPTQRDERYPKILGALFVLVAAYLAIAFVSYLFSWKGDQDKVLQFSWSIFAQSDLTVDNWLGRLGAVVSNMFFYWGFGLASFFVVALSAKFGTTLMARQPMSGFWKFAKLCVLGMIFCSVALEFALHGAAFPWGGAFGDSTYMWLGGTLGQAGLFLLLIFSAGIFAIWMFNPNLTKWDFDWTLQFNKPAWLGFPDLKFLKARPTITHNTSTEVTAVAVSEPVATPEAAMDDTDDTEEDPASDPTLQPTFLERYREMRENGELDEGKDSGPEADEGSQLEFEVSKDVSAKQKRSKPERQTELEISAPTPSDDSAGDLDEDAPVQVTEHQNHDPSVSHAELHNLDHSEPYDPKADLSGYEAPELELLEEYSEHKVEIDRAELEANKDQIIETLLNYKIEITKIRATIGPTVTLYEIVPAAGVRISRIKNLEDDIALSLAALGIRIIAPMPGKGTIGIEVPNKKKQIVSLKEVLRCEKFLNAKMDLPVALGKTISNEVFVADLAKMPHLLVAGATGQGKSVGVNTILMSLLYKKHPSQLKLVLIDPKKVELFPYSRLDKHFLAFVPDQEDPIITDTKKVIYTLNSLCIEMDQRYDLLKQARARNIREYNDKFVNRKLNPRNGHRFMPYIVLVIDEFADLIMTAGKEVELPIGRLAQLARAVGIHLIIATQRPSVNIITGVIKANFPARLAYKVTSKIDSRTILDAGGAEQLIGRGDMLLSVGSNLIRLQCAFVDTPEVERVIDCIGDQRGYPEPFYLPEFKDADEAISGADGLTFGELDDMFEDAARLVVQNQHGSTSMIQRRLRLGYNRAGRIMDQLEAVGIVGGNEGSKAREVLVFSEIELDNFLVELRKRR